LGTGSEFVVRLPLADADADAPAAASPGAAPPRRADAALQVLIADDNHDAAASLAALLELEGHRVEVVHDGADALEALRRARPELALLDIGMPKVNGYEIARRTRAEPWGRATTLVAVTGWGQDSDRERALAAGFDRHGVKPIDPNAALELCATLAAMRRT
jgi:CheY-like chemotaxis protein